MSALQEVGEVNKMLQMKLNPWIGWIIATIIIITILCILSVAIPQILGSKQYYWAPNAKKTLRAYGDIQEAYKEANSQGTYASWDELVNYGWVKEGYTRSTMIEQYSVWTSSEMNTFIIVAFPRKTSPPGYLATFAIREDQILREYQPDKHGNKAWGEDEDYTALTWEPVR